MAYFTQLKRIVETDDTADKAIESYGSFVSFANRIQARVQKSNRRDWTRDRISLANCKNTASNFHEAISEKFGKDIMVLAIETHPFK